MDTNYIINEAKEALKKGKIFDVLRAKNLLMENGFINNKDKELQKAFFELFPPSKELQQELSGSLKQLLDKDPAVRSKAAVYLEKISRKSTSSKIEIWMKDPRTIEILLKSLEMEDPVVQENIIMCLGNIAERYHYTDLEIYNRIVSLYEKTSGALKTVIAQSVSAFPTNEKWDVILKSFHGNPAESNHEILGRCIFGSGDDMPVQYREKFYPVLFDALYKNKKVDTRYSLIRALEVIGNEETITQLKKVRADLKTPDLNDDFDNAIEVIQQNIKTRK